MFSECGHSWRPEIFLRESIFVSFSSLGHQSWRHSPSHGCLQSLALFSLLRWLGVETCCSSVEIRTASPHLVNWLQLAVRVFGFEFTSILSSFSKIAQKNTGSLTDRMIQATILIILLGLLFVFVFETNVGSAFSSMNFHANRSWTSGVNRHLIVSLFPRSHCATRMNTLSEKIWN